MSRLEKQLMDATRISEELQTQVATQGRLSYYHIGDSNVIMGGHGSWVSWLHE
jgi:hypothetical protein